MPSDGQCGTTEGFVWKQTGVSLLVWTDSNNSAKSDLRACTHHVVLETDGAFPSGVWLLLPLPEPVQGDEQILLGFWSKTSKVVK